MLYYINMPLIGVIGGSGLYEIPGLAITARREMETPFGRPSAPYSIGRIGGADVAFLPRHGAPHRIQPHRINYRANIWGFRELGAERLISVNASGGINPALAPGGLVVLDQIIDMTQGAREATFYDADDVVHVDFTEPYCPEMRAAALEAGRLTGAAPAETGTYVCVNGPRLESRAEIGSMARAGGDVVGMTGMPEAALARELEICLLGLTVVTNPAAGIAGRKLTTDEVVRVMGRANETVKTLLVEIFALIPARRACPCKDALKGAGMDGAIPSALKHRPV
jgi:5'-methylthioadenosine phosphorylase